MPWSLRRRSHTTQTQPEAELPSIGALNSPGAALLLLAFAGYCATVLQARKLRGGRAHMFTAPPPIPYSTAGVNVHHRARGAQFRVAGGSWLR